MLLRRMEEGEEEEDSPPVHPGDIRTCDITSPDIRLLYAIVLVLHERPRKRVK